MALRKVTILDKAAEEVAYIAYYIESKGMPVTAKRFVDDAFSYFEKLGDDCIKHKPCKYSLWKWEGYRCANYKKKYVVAFIDTETEIIICDFALQKLMR